MYYRRNPISLYYQNALRRPIRLLNIMLSGSTAAFNTGHLLYQVAAVVLWNERRFYDGKQQLVVFGETRTPSPLTPLMPSSLPRLFNKDARSGDTMCEHAAAACRNVSAVHSELFADSWVEWRPFSSDLMTLLYLRPPYILIKVVVTPIWFQLASSLRDVTQREGVAIYAKRARSFSDDT